MHRRVWLLIFVTAGIAMAEAAALRSAGDVSVLGLAPQVTAPPPYGVFHDMRWLFVYNSSWFTFAWQAAALVVVRTLLSTLVITLAWPEPDRDHDHDHGRPSLRSMLLSNFGFAVTALFVLSPWACISFAASGTSLSWFVLGEVLEFVFLSVVLQRGGVVPRWWLGLPSLRAVAISLATFATLTVGSMIVNLTSGWAAVPVAGLMGAVNALLWRGLIRAVLPRIWRSRQRSARLLDGPAGRRLGLPVLAAFARRLRVPAARSAAARLTRIRGLATAAAVAVTAGGLLFIGHAFGDEGNEPIPPPMRAQAVHGKPRLAVLFVAGYDSSFHVAHPVVTSPGMTYETYSYRGLNGRGQPAPYSGVDTHQSLARSVRRLAAQVQALHTRTGLPVGLVADSEGTLVTRAYLMRARHPAVDALVMFSPLIRPGRVYYPPRGTGSGFGYVTGLELQGLLDTLRDAGGPPMSDMEPFVRSIVDHAPVYRNHMLCPAPGVRSMAVLPLAAATSAPPGPISDIPVIEEPGTHASLERERPVRAEMTAFLRGDPLRQRTMASFTLLRYAADAWMAPALPLSANPAWRYPAGAPDAAFGGPICTAR